ncbi:MAG: DegT/DnrJ/EryC1/StrS family aminotransferase [Magnetococcales bacterium]|nr:DegT/DnrJ/EryC1/StrS family aminotransferase [Magnetococcales bacterium]
MHAPRKVPFFNYPHIFTHDEKGFLEVITGVGRRGAFIMQKDLSDFEKRLAAFTGARYALGVANATDGLQMALMAGGIKAGDEVLFCSHTMIATASAIHFAGGVPVPVETGPDHLMDPTKLERHITPRTRAIMPTQLNGRVANMDAIQAIADKHGLQVYEDAAQALGAKYKGRCAGTFGVGACISFYPAKVLGCLGDGGAVLCNDDAVYQKLYMLRDHGRSEQTGEVEMWGFNSRLDNLQAALLNYQLDHFPQVIERRRQVARIYQERLGSLKQLVLPPAPGSEPDHFDVFQNYEIEAERRDELKRFLADRGVGTLIQWGGKAVHQFGAALGFDQSLPVTERMFKSMIMLPMNMSQTDDDVAYVCDCIREFYHA